MNIGIPREVKPLEGRVALIPQACASLMAQGHTVWVQKGAGRHSGYEDSAFVRAGVRLVDDVGALYESADLVVKVKEPEPEECTLLRAKHILFSYLHLAVNERLVQALKACGLTAVAFESVAEAGALPLLTPMSVIAGRLAVQTGVHLLHRPMGGKGLLIGGAAGAQRGHVVIVGTGVAGWHAAQTAAAMGARVTCFDVKPDRLEAARTLGPNVTALYPYPDDVGQSVSEADLLIGAVLQPGRRAPRVVSREMIAAMQEGSVAVDIAIDQGGCMETSRPCTYEQAPYVEEGVVHFPVTNLPGAVPRTASQALSAALAPFVSRLASPDWRQDKALSAGVTVASGKVVHPPLLSND